MERKIQFRGKRADNGEWVFGGFMLNRDEQPCIMAFNPDDTLSMILIEPDTLGQFTGLTDCNGKPIYEHDIIAIPKVGGFLSYIGFNDKTASFCLVEVAYNQDLLCGTATLGEMLSHYRDAYVNGNIHDNPEMLKK